MLLHNLPKVIDIIIYHISIPDSQAIDSILKLVSVLSRDMRYIALSFILILQRRIARLLRQASPHSSLSNGSSRA